MKTQLIFNENNLFQGDEIKVVFVCSVGMLRSPTAARIASKYKINARSCGSDIKIALIPINKNLIEWADKIVFMNSKNYSQILKNENFDSHFLDLVNKKSLIWHINDDYNYMQKSLIDELNLYFKRDFTNV